MSNPQDRGPVPLFESGRAGQRRTSSPVVISISQALRGSGRIRTCVGVCPPDQQSGAMSRSATLPSAPPAGLEPAPADSKSAGTASCHHGGWSWTGRNRTCGGEVQSLAGLPADRRPSSCWVVLGPAPRNRTSSAEATALQAAGRHRPRTGWGDRRDSNPLPPGSHPGVSASSTSITAPPAGLEPATVALTGRRTTDRAAEDWQEWRDSNPRGVVLEASRHTARAHSHVVVLLSSPARIRTENSRF